MNRDNTPMNQWVQETLDSLNGVQRATANPYLFTRVMARLQSRQAGSNREPDSYESVARWISRPAFAMSAVILFLALNIAVALRFGQHRQPAQENTDQAVAAEFNGATYAFYDLTADK
jgi:anti-sigma-K factor RskA